MFRIKKLYSFTLETFLPLLLATFSVCLFILLMQFLWKYVDDMVGKGVGINVLAELFFYAALSLIPLTLPLAILLASLMTFGNLGEHLELLAMKSSGISLLNIMKPLVVLSIFISGIAFVFQNNVLPPVQVKLWTIVFSLKQTSPELDIPEASFYKQISGYNVYVRKKNKDGLLRDVMIYNYSRGFDDAEVIVADSGRIKMSNDKKYLILSLFSGKSFENLGSRRTRSSKEQIPYQRETFKLRDILIEFDSNFNMADESIMQNRDISKNLKELRLFIDSVSIENDSVVKAMSPGFVNYAYAGSFKRESSSSPTSHTQADSAYIDNFELFYKNASTDRQLQIIEQAKSKTDRVNNDYVSIMHQQTDTLRQIRGHQIEFIRKFALSLACLLFFFIGAPLGAIIRKGGLGLPAVISVFLFILYYTVDTFGFKLAKQGVWPVWQGMWISTLLLALLGIFLTYKAVNDSVMINPDAWKNIMQRVFGKGEIRNYSRKEVIMTPPDYQKNEWWITDGDTKANQYLIEKRKFPFYVTFWNQNFRDKQLKRLVFVMNRWIEDLRNSDENLIIGKLMDYPVMTPVRLDFLNKPLVRWSFAVFFPLGLIIYILCFYRQRQINRELSLTLKVNEEIVKMIAGKK